MKQCTIYTPFKDRAKIVAAIRTAFTGKVVETDSSNLKVKVTYKRIFSGFCIDCSLMTAETEPQAFREMMQGMHGFFSQIKTNHKSVQNMLLGQIEYLNCCIGIVCDKDFDEDSSGRILEAVRALDGVLFTPPGEMRDGDGNLILDRTGKSELEKYVVRASASILDDHINVTKSGQDRKKRSVSTLCQQGIPYTENLPVIVGDEDAKLRTLDEVAERAVALALMVTFACDVASGRSVPESRNFLETLIQRFNAGTFFTGNEIEFIGNNRPDESAVAQFAWQYECLWVLLWAMGFVEELNFPEDICDTREAISYFQEVDDFDAFLAKAVLRSKSEILDQADLIYRYNWACVDARIKDLQPPGGLNDEVVVERHRALNWLICDMDADWDYVKTHT